MMFCESNLMILTLSSVLSVGKTDSAYYYPDVVPRAVNLA